MNSQVLESRIQDAFSHVPYPGDDNIGSPDGRDDAENVADSFRGKTWQAIMHTKIWPPAVHSLTNQAFHYYFPAFLIRAMNDDSGDFTEYLLAALTPPKKKDQISRLEFQSKFSDFSKTQKDVIRQFLDWLIQTSVKWDLENNWTTDYSDWNKLRQEWDGI